MNRCVRWLAILAFVAGAPLVAPAGDRFPRPDFTNYVIPTTSAPSRFHPLHEYVDLAFFVVGLGVATHLALTRRSRRGLFLLSLVSLAWLGFFREGCVCAVGSLQNVAEAAVNPGCVLTYSIIVMFALPILTALFFGRTFCSSICPLGAIQELVTLRPVRIPRWLEHALGILPYVYLGLVVLYATVGTAYAQPHYLICSYDPFVGFFRRTADASMLLLGACFLTVGVFVGRPYCRFLCPYGAILGVCSKLSQNHVRIPPGDCISCRLCEEACPYGAILPPTVDPTPQERVRGRNRLAFLVVLAPLLVIGGAYLGGWLGAPLSRLHPTVSTAVQVRLEKLGKVEGTTDAAEAFRNTGRPDAQLYEEASALERDYVVAARWLGAWVGFVVAAKLIHLAIRRRRAEYQPDRSRCVSCGRCFWYCPPEQVRLGLIPAIPELPQADARKESASR